MSQPDNAAWERLYHMMEHLMVLAANQQQPDAPSPRDLVTREDARDAVLQIAAVIDEATKAGRIPVERGVHAAAMLMLVRDYIQPLEEVPGKNGADMVTPDLLEILKELRRASGGTGIQG